MTGARRQLRTVPLALLILYTIFIGLVTLTPNQLDTGPGSFIAGLLEFLASHRATAWIDYVILEKLANVGMFVPFGLLVALQCGPHRWWVGWVEFPDGPVFFATHIDLPEGASVEATDAVAQAARENSRMRWR